MKYLILIVCIFFITIGKTSSQNYYPVQLNSTAWFKTFYEDYIYDEKEIIHALRVDSSQITNNGTYFYFQSGMSCDSDMCYNPWGNSWLGAYALQTVNNYWYFFNSNNDSILLRPLEGVNQSWVCFSRNEIVYHAKVVSVEEGNFLGITDSLKTISIYNPSTRITLFNLVISKNHGFVKLISFYDFGIENVTGFAYLPGHEWELVGHTDSNQGFSNFEAADVFNFEPGDEIHTHQYDSLKELQVICKDIRIIKKYLSKQVSANSDTIVYTVEQCIYHKMMQIGESIFYNVFSKKDTVYEKYTLSEYNFIALLPGQGYYDDIYHLICNAGLYPSPNKNVSGNFGYFEGCWHALTGKTYLKEIFNSFYNSNLNIGRFFVGLGGPYNWQEGCDYQFNKIVYFKKGIQESGTPWDCSTILTLSANNVCKSDNKVYPNPMNHINPVLHFEYIERGEFELYRYDGRKIGNFIIENGYSKINEILIPGIYFCKIKIGKSFNSFKILVE